MNINFNIGKNSSKLNSNNSDNNGTTPVKNDNNDMKKKMIKFMGVIVIGTIVLLLIIFILSLFTKKEYSYEDIETVLQSAAKSYFKDHKDSLPTAEDQIVEIDAANLIAEERMKDLSEYTKEGVVCTGRVQVQKVSSEYVYTPYLSCGEDYITQELYKVVTTKEKVVTSGYGLYSIDGNYVFRGEKVNNYVKLDKGLWRIVKITANNNIVLIKDEEAGQPLSWDDRYNQDTIYASGINTYSASRIKDTLEDLYNNPKSKDDEFLSKTDKTKIVSYNVCTAKRATNEVGSDNTIECSEVLKDQKVGLLTASDYIRASIDPNCTSTASRSCQNYNYLTSGYSWWLGTAVKENTSEVYSINDNGKIESGVASGYASIRPVIYLNDKVGFKSGKGTIEKPYKIK